MFDNNNYNIIIIINWNTGMASVGCCDVVVLLALFLTFNHVFISFAHLSVVRLR